MMKTTQARAGNHRRFRIPLRFDWPQIGCVFAERVVNAVFLIVHHIIANKAPQVLFVQRDHVVQQLPSTTSHPALRDAILPR